MRNLVKEARTDWRYPFWLAMSMGMIAFTILVGTLLSVAINDRQEKNDLRQQVAEFSISEDCRQKLLDEYVATLGAGVGAGLNVSISFSEALLILSGDGTSDALRAEILGGLRDNIERAHPAARTLDKAQAKLEKAVETCAD